MQHPKLGPCPLCGMEPQLIADHAVLVFIKAPVILCVECGLNLPMMHGQSITDLIAKWNEREDFKQ